MVMMGSWTLEASNWPCWHSSEETNLHTQYPVGGHQPRNGQLRELYLTLAQPGKAPPLSQPKSTISPWSDPRRAARCMLGLRPRLKTRPSLLDLLDRYHIDLSNRTAAHLPPIGEGPSIDTSYIHSPSGLPPQLGRIKSAPALPTARMPSAVRSSWNFTVLSGD